MSSPPEGSRKTSEGILISVCPDWCLTPCGSAMVPVPYTIHAYQNDDANTAATVRQTRKRSHTKGSVITISRGAEPGTGRGVKSRTVSSVCTPKTWSETVFIEGKNAVRHGDEWWMNNKNTYGKLIYVKDTRTYELPQAAKASLARDLLGPDGASPVQQDLYSQLSPDQIEEAIKARAQQAAAQVTADAADAAADLAPTAANLAAKAAADEALDAAAETAAKVVTVGGADVAATAVTGGVAGVAIGMMPSATAHDEITDLVQLPPDIDPRTLDAFESDAVQKGGMMIATNSTGLAPGDVSTGVVDIIRMHRGQDPDNIRRIMRKSLEFRTVLERDLALYGGGLRVSTLSREKNNECIVGPYDQIADKCPQNSQAHHIVPDYTMRYGSREESEVAAKPGLSDAQMDLIWKRIPHAPSLPSLHNGMAICLRGNAEIKSGSPATEHWEAHGADVIIAALGAGGTYIPRMSPALSFPPGTASLKSIVEASETQVCYVKPACCPAVVTAVADEFKDIKDMSSIPGRTVELVRTLSTSAKQAIESGKLAGQINK